KPNCFQASKSELRDRRAKKPSFITPGGSRLSDLDDDDLVETLRSTAGALASRGGRNKKASSPDDRQKKKGGKEDSGRVGVLFKLTVCQHFMLLFAMLAFGFVAMLLFMPNPIDPVAYQLPPQPPAVGPLAANDRLAAARKLLVGAVRGPESFVFVGEHLFTGTLDGRIVRVHLASEQPELWVRFGPANCSLQKSFSPIRCGRPLGLRRHPSNRSRLLVADAYLGLIDVNLDKRQFQSIIDRSNPIGVTFFDDLDITPDGELVFISEASTRYPLHQLMHQMLEGSSNGRLIMLNMTSGHAATVLEGLSFPNGVQLHPDGQSVLVAETSGFKIIRYYFAGPMAGQTRTFADNLPLGPDNIRLSSDGKHLWVSGSLARLAGLRSSADLMGQRTWLRLAAAKILPGPLLHNMAAGHYGLVLRLAINDGRIVDSLHDTQGKQITHSSEVQDYNGRLFIGTYYGPYLATLDL
uniref:Str_synth domain-containing protein n=2 Tax=Macrostomum lignano TaxID=282301 RepID=A0A1I8GGA1_9PLAT